MNNDLQARLFSMADEKYRAFHSALMPTVEKEKVIGIRTPELRKFAKEFSKSAQKEEFLKDLPHKYYEENNLHAFLLEQEKDYASLIEKLNIFLPFVDNWATCDMMKPPLLKSNKQELIEEIKKWISSEETYAVRYGINCLMTYFLGESFSEEHFDWVARIKSEEYYINMMRAWYFATALYFQYPSAIRVIEEKRLDKWTHNKAISKARESYRISGEIKEYLKTLKY